MNSNQVTDIRIDLKNILSQHINIFSISIISLLLSIFIIGCASANPSITSTPTFTNISTDTSVPILTTTNTPLPKVTNLPVSIPTPETLVEYSDYLINLGNIDKYKENLIIQESKGGGLSCPGESGWEYKEYLDCSTFYELKELECMGYHTPDMYRERSYDLFCKQISHIDQIAKPEALSIELDPDNWWNNLPAEIIPVRGGSFAPGEYEHEKQIRDNMVIGKRLSEIPFIEAYSNYDSEYGYLEFVGYLNSYEYPDCGFVYDEFYIRPELIADFDDDSIGELLLWGYRTYSSENCLLGSINALDAYFYILIDWDDPSDPPNAIQYP